MSRYQLARLATLTFVSLLLVNCARREEPAYERQFVRQESTNSAAPDETVLADELPTEAAKFRLGEFEAALYLTLDG